MASPHMPCRHPRHVLCRLMTTAGPGPPPAASVPPPINVIYSHLHDSIRHELDALAAAVVALQQKGAAGGPASGGSGGLAVELEALRERYRFLEQVYTYHSSVEDEVGIGFVCGRCCFRWRCFYGWLFLGWGGAGYEPGTCLLGVGAAGHAPAAWQPEAARAVCLRVWLLLVLRLPACRGCVHSACVLVAASATTKELC